jgi:hypothetical protein
VSKIQRQGTCFIGPIAEYLITSSEKRTPLAFLMASDLRQKRKKTIRTGIQMAGLQLKLSDVYIHIPSLAVTYHDTHVATLLTQKNSNYGHTKNLH